MRSVIACNPKQSVSKWIASVERLRNDAPSYFLDNLVLIS